jgi:glutamine synthetase
MILPAALKYQHDVAAALTTTKAAGVSSKAQGDLLKELVDAADSFRLAALKLDKTIASEAHGDVLAKARHMRNVVLPAMAELRKIGDRLELMVDDTYWPLPTYQEMLFVR